MPHRWLESATFIGPALPGPFVEFELERELQKLKLLPATGGSEGTKLTQFWEFYRRKLGELRSIGQDLRVRNHVLEPLLTQLGYGELEPSEKVATREGLEDGGTVALTPSGDRLRVFASAFEADLDAPNQRGRAYRFSPTRVAQRVLLASGERVGFITNGVQFRLLICDPARPDSYIEISIPAQWRRYSRDVPDTLLLILALASSAGVKQVPAITEKARLSQAKVTKDLRVQARQAIEGFVQHVLDLPANHDTLELHTDRAALAKQLWHEGLTLVYRLLFILKLESTDDPARAFAFTSSTLWQNTYSPSRVLSFWVDDVLTKGAETGSLLEDGLRIVFRMFEQGVEHRELMIKPLGGALFGKQAMPLLDSLGWGEHAVAILLRKLLWTSPKKGKDGAPRRVYYGPLDVEDLGSVYEALLELEPGITTEPMCRLRRAKLEVVVPTAQGERYRTVKPTAVEVEEESDEADEEDEPEEEADDAPARGKKTKIEWIEEIPPRRFYLRVGLGRKASGSYYTPHSFVRFLVEQTVGELAQQWSPKADPQPAKLLEMTILDPAMGSGHFLVEACRFLGEKLYEACRLCDELALEEDKKAERAKFNRESGEQLAAEKHATLLRQRILDIPDPNDELVLYMPSHAVEGGESGISEKKALALCRRLVAVHCLYGVDKNPLAVELAKLSLWLETHSEGYPLTFLDHRLALGDSLTGPFIEHLRKHPGSQQPLDDLFAQGLSVKLQDAFGLAMGYIHDLEATVGINLSETLSKEQARQKLERALAPFKVLAAAWSGGVMLGLAGCDDWGYAQLVKAVAETGNLPDALPRSEKLRRMIALGLGVDVVPDTRDGLIDLLDDGDCVPGLAYELAFPRVFYPTGGLASRRGFDIVLGNPPWETITINRQEWFAPFDFEVLNATSQKDRDHIEKRLLEVPEIQRQYQHYVEWFEQFKRSNDTLLTHQKLSIDGKPAGRFLDAFRLFMERNYQLQSFGSLSGTVVPSAFHANEGATGVRKLYLEELSLRCCFSFENKRKLFEIDSRFKFAVVVAAKTGPTVSFQCAFYLHDDEWLFGQEDGKRLVYTRTFVESTGGPQLTFLEILDDADLLVIEQCIRNAHTIGSIWDRQGQSFSTSEMNLNLDKKRLRNCASQLAEHGFTKQVVASLVESKHFPLIEGRNLWHFTCYFSKDIRFVIPFEQLGDKQHWFRLASYFRASYRKIASSTNERTLVWSFIPPGSISSESCPSEQSPWKRPNAKALGDIALMNCFVPDYTTRLRVATTVSMFMLRLTPIQAVEQRTFALLAHSALRLLAQDGIYEPLWREQLGETWREERKSPLSWPVLAEESERWAIRAAIDAVVADAYGLSRDQYQHVLSTFSHKSYPKAPELCVAAYDELVRFGLDEFTKKHDPYWDIPLNESLPQPVIDLPIPAGAKTKRGSKELFGE